MSDRHARNRALVLPSRAVLLEGLAVLAFFTGVAVFATWPLARHPLGGFYGFGNDNWGGIWTYGWLHDAYLGSPSASFTNQLQTPFGWEIPEQAIQPTDKVIALIFGGLDQGLGAYNIQIFSSFVLAGCTMYILARYVTGRRLAAAVAGFIYTFSPFHLAQGMQYAALASIQWLPLFLLALLVCLRSRRLRDAAFAGAALALVAATSYYQAWFLAWFTAVMFAAFAVLMAVQARRRASLTWPNVRHFAWLAVSRTALGLAVAVTLLAPALVVSVRAASENKASLMHPLTEAVRYSGRPWMLFVPPHDNPIFGPHVRAWVQQHLYDNPLSDQSIYLGYTALALALLGLIAGVAARNTRFLLASGGLAGFVILMGPYLPLDKDYWRLWATPEATSHLPSLGYVMFELGPQFRFFSRAFILVLLCLAPLAALGFARLEDLVPSAGLRVTLAAAAVALIGLEYTNAPPHVWFQQKPPPWVEAVRALPRGSAVADYPIASLNSPRSLYYMFWQRKHRHPTLNPNEDPQSQALAGEVAAPDDPSAGRALHDAGIDYAVVHTRLPPQTTPPYQPALPDDSMPSDAGETNPWFKLVRRTPDAVVYRVLDSPRQTKGAIARATSGFGAVEHEGRASARWLESRDGVLTLYVTGKPRPLTLALTLSSFARSRRTILLLDGRRISSFETPPNVYTTHNVPLGRPGEGVHTLVLRASPGPQSIRAATGAPDPRSVSLRLREPVVILGSRRR